MTAEPADLTEPDPTAVMVRRTIAHLIDTVLYAAAFLIPAVLLVDKRDFAPGETLDRLSTADNGDLVGYVGNKVYTLAESDVAVAAAVSIGVFLLIAVILQGLTGTTIGKLVTGIRTVRPDGSRPGIVRAFLRSLLWIIDGIPTTIPMLFLPLVGGLVALVTTGRRRLGDLVARTYVVHRSFVGTPIVESDEPDDAEAEAAEGDVPESDVPESDGPPLTEPDATRAVADDHPGHVTITGADQPGAADNTPPVAEDDAPAQPESDAAGGVADEPATPTTTGDAPTEPKWDPQRKAYISYDPRRGGWMQHDTESGEWVPITTA